MKIFALSDLHLGEGLDKAMDKFGDEWKNHAEKIKDNWLNTVSDSDTVLVPGDISWAINMKEAETHLEFVSKLPGRKIMLRGNHDYWWSSVSRLNGLYNKKNIFFIQNDCFVMEDKKTAVCGSRLWKSDSTEREDIEIYNREIIRSRLSLDDAMRKQCENIIFMCHYPPLEYDGKDIKDTKASRLLEEYPVAKVVYGHLHGRENFKNGFEGIKNNIEYRLVSADYIDFTPIRII